MLPMMDAVLLLKPGCQPHAVRGLVLAAGLSLQPMFAGSTDADSRRWWTIEPADAPALPALLARLAAHADVDAAYLKPAGEAPPG